MTLRMGRRWAALALAAALATACGSDGKARSGGASASTRPPSAAAPPSASPSGTPAQPAVRTSSGAKTLPPGPDGAPVVFEHGPRSRPRVALTFDGDMTAAMEDRLRTGKTATYDNTALIADLRRLRVPATFFLTGMWIDEYPAEARGLAADPLFEVASHSLTHRGFAGTCYGLGHVPDNEMAAEVRAPFDRLAGVPGRVVPYFRFPGGCYDAAALRAIAPTGALPIQWDVISGDADGSPGKDIAATVLSQSRNGSVVVMHCSLGAAAHTADAIDAVVTGLRAKGFELVRVSDLVADTPGAVPGP